MAMDKAKISAILLAAGESRRMGDINKLHMPIDGLPLLRRSVETLLAAELGDIVVVLGHDRANTQTLLKGLPVNTVFNQDYESGQMTSVHCGLGSLRQAFEGVIIALGDQPALRAMAGKSLFLNTRVSAETQSLSVTGAKRILSLANITSAAGDLSKITPNWCKPWKCRDPR